ncbi:MAG: UDP-N-acetylmuramoyl-L-alanine--D-glutamate ligase [Candidatus Liptonbacteria bacterium]|nr:UDP-N-acetylmuramoyl-L-alanine--D-glutamate ligase [Candidatus Liptonbacteria bacterium]
MKSNLKIAILTYHREGRSVLRYLLRHPNLFPGAIITACDADPKTRVPHGVQKQVGPTHLSNLGQFDLIFRTPGLSYFRREFRNARRQGARFTSLTELFFSEAPKRINRNHLIAVTGSKGKSTTATLIYRFLKAAGKPVFFAGNIGQPALEILPRLTRKSWVVLELSSFQLEELRQSPHIAVMCELFPEHLDIHGSRQRYYQAKSQLVRNQKKNDLVFYLSRNPDTARVVRLGPGRKIPVGDMSPLFSPADLKVRGGHQYRNAVLAATVAEHLGVPAKIIQRVTRSFPGLPHRLQLVRRAKPRTVPLGGSHAWAKPRTVLPGRSGAWVDFYDDSASTNPTATVAALSAFADTPHVLLAGGRDKDLNYRPLAQAIRKNRTRAVVLIGQDKEKIARAIRATRVPIYRSATLSAAVRKAYALAKKFPPRSAVVFSPAALSFDMFRNYQDRGEQFQKIVSQLG